MHCSCSGPTLLWKLQRLTGLQKLSLISKSGLSAYNDHVQNTSDTCGLGLFSEHDFPCYKAYSSSPGALRAAIHTSCQSLSPALSPCTSTPRVQLTTFASQPSSDLQAQQLCEQHSVAATKASAAFAKTKNLFKEDMAYALEYAQPASPRIAAQRDSMSSRASSHSAVSVRSKATANHQAPNGSSSVSRASSTRSANSVADSVSSYHGYTGVNYHAGIKDIDAVPNSWGLSLNDYKAVLGSGYVHGCVPWEDQHVDKSNTKQFQKLHSRRVQLLQELHTLESDIRHIMK